MRAQHAARAGASAEVAACLRAFESESDYVHRALLRRGVPPGDAEDLAQDVFLILWRRWPELDHGRPLRPWLSGVVVKVAQQYRKREGRFVPAGLVDREDRLRASDDQLGGARARALVLRSLAKLPEKQRTLVIKHDLEGQPMRELAAQLGVPLFTAYTRLRSGRKNLAAAIEELQARPRRMGVTVLGRLGELLARWRWRAGVCLGAAGLAAVGLALAPGHSSRPAGRAAESAAAGQADSRSLARGLVGYWRFDERAGDLVADRSGAGNDCLLRSTNGQPHGRRVEGVAGGALELDGKGWLECPGAGRLAQLETELTIALWVRAGEGPESRQALVTRQLDTSGDRLFSLRLQHQRVEFLSHVWKTQLGRPFAGTGWTHLAAVRDAAGTRLYLNGVEVGRNARTAPGRIGGGSGALIVGGQVNGPEPAMAHDRFRGSLDELVVYGRALPAPEIAALAARVQPALP
jgi:RNA polymerase sigma-70 factor (ECF subfamily)